MSEQGYDFERERRRARWLSNIMGGVCTIALMGIYGWMLLRISDDRDRIAELERGCPDPIVEMAEYRGVVHALETCGDRLHEVQAEMVEAQDAYDHWTYIARLVNDPDLDPDTSCMLLVERATRDFREACEDELYVVQAEVQDECWCPQPVGGLSEVGGW